MNTAVDHSHAERLASRLDRQARLVDSLCGGVLKAEARHGMFSPEACELRRLLTAATDREVELETEALRIGGV